MTDAPSRPEPPDPLSPDPGDAPTTEQPPAPRRLLRARDDRIIGGVCAGLGRHLGVDPWVVRIGFIVTVFLGGAGVVAYLAALAFVPEDDGHGAPAGPAPLTGSRASTIAGVAVLAIAALWVLDGAAFGVGWFLGPNLLGLALLAGLAYAAYRALEGRDGGTPPVARVAGAVLLALAVLALAGVGFVAAFWLAAAGGGTVAAGVVIALGVVAAVAAFVRPVRWLAPAALVVAIPVAIVAAADIDLDGGIGQRTYRPATVAELRDGGYQLGVGELVLDLRELQWPRTGLVETEVEVGVGHVLVLVPRGVCVRASGRLGVGALTVMGDESGGVDVDQELGTGGLGDAPRLVLTSRAGVGHIEVDTHPDRDRDRGWWGDHDEDDPLAPQPPDAPAPAGDCERT
ncbi:MAG TPA: PspC domain-containing protein [Baekduia sp.]|nr:PspC domain-containing protein [Baekduia sp.]